MLAHLLIKNYALIEHLEISPDASLNIVTGETGAGKSIMLGALGLLMGKRADSKALYDQKSKCFIEGTFEIEGYNLSPLFESLDLDYENPCLIRREVSPSGKSRAFINDSPVTLDVLKQISQRLIDVHSQHDSILLGESDYQLGLLDALAGNAELLAEYSVQFKVFQAASKALKKLELDSQALKKEFDYNNFLLEELSNANLKENEQESIEKKLAVLENAEEVKLKLSQVSNILNHPEQSLVSNLQESVSHLNGIAKLSPIYEELKKRIQSVQLELADIADELENQEDKVVYEPEQIDLLKSRLDLLFGLQQKHGVREASELKVIENELQLKVEQVLNFDGELKKLNTECESAKKLVSKTASQLSKKRLACVKELEGKVIGLLKELGIPNADFKVKRTEKEIEKNGLDSIEFLFSANKGFELQGLRKVASGGEFSRLMLALKYILADRTAMPSLIFDEIDTGISGEVAVKMGVMMRQMSEHLQLIAITHLHQIAGKGTSHFFVYKNDTAERTVSSIKKLEKDERILEIAKMIGGENPSESSIKSALELMQA